MHILPGYDPNVWYDAVDMLISVLCEEYFVGPELATIDLIHTTPPPLFEYASRLMDERGIEPSRFNVKEILLTGGPLVASSRAYLAKLWNAAVVATYSCTEVRSEAMECAANPRVYHPSPSMVAEVLDRRTGRHVGHGEAGEVALTGLFPFQRVMPMVRYRPGDFARFFSAPCTCGSSTVGIEPLGRTQDLLDLTELPHHPRVIGTTGVFEALGPIPQVPKFPYPRAEFAKTTVDGKTSVELRIEATDPRSFAAKPVEDRILELLLDADPDLRLLKETAEIALSVKLVPKNSLSHFFRIYPGR